MCECVVCVVCVCEWEDRREEGGADTALKTKTPHVNVGKNVPNHQPDKWVECFQACKIWPIWLRNESKPKPTDWMRMHIHSTSQASG